MQAASFPAFLGRLATTSKGRDTPAPRSARLYTRRASDLWLLIITGRPPTTLAPFRKECLPSVQVVRIEDNDKVDLRSFGHWDDPEEDEEPREELDDCIRALLDGEDDDEEKHYPDGTYPLCDVRYDHKAIREPRVFTELRFTTWEGSNMAYTRTTRTDVLNVGFEEAVGHVLPVRQTALVSLRSAD